MDGLAIATQLRGDDALARHILSGVLELPTAFGLRICFAPETRPMARFAAAVAGLRLPLALQQQLMAWDVGIVLGSFYDAAAPRGPQQAPSPVRRDNRRTYRNQSPGLYEKPTGTAYAFQYSLSRAVVPQPGLRPDAAGVAAGVWEINSARLIARVTRHELWHAIDDKSGLPSRWSGFQRAYVADVAGQGGAVKLRAEGWGYFIQDDLPYRGASEVFAEVGAALNGGGVCGRGIVERFPACTQFVRQFQNDLTAARTLSQRVA